MVERAKALTGKAPALSTNTVHALSKTVWKSVFAGTVHALSTNNIHALSKNVWKNVWENVFVGSALKQPFQSKAGIHNQPHFREEKQWKLKEVAAALPAKFRTSFLPVG
ncbi:hypothetical protein [uncultured Bartonella sp.]|uniref:hypothetical protein n=1 Tax=uncultured Bartonella sp. TaxID=104108 RepID=UPI0025E94D2C|nr:hypothetical protein [uncultured Bartonella sp.]